MTALPLLPGRGPSLYQPTVSGPDGAAIASPAVRPTSSMAALRPILGMISRTGRAWVPFEAAAASAQPAVPRPASGLSGVRAGAMSRWTPADRATSAPIRQASATARRRASCRARRLLLAALARRVVDVSGCASLVVPARSGTESPGREQQRHAGREHAGREQPRRAAASGGVPGRGQARDDRGGAWTCLLYT